MQRMESTGDPGRIQISQTTAAILAAAGLGNMVNPRSGGVEIKGKGVMQTYWLSTSAGVESSSGCSSEGLSSNSTVDQRNERNEEDEPEIQALERRVFDRFGRGSELSSL